jgi:hypothetical protein
VLGAPALTPDADPSRAALVLAACARAAAVIAPLLIPGLGVALTGLLVAAGELTAAAAAPIGTVGLFTSLAGRLELKTGIDMGVLDSPPRPKEPQILVCAGSRIATRCTALSSLGVNCSSIASTGTRDIFSEDWAGNVMYCEAGKTVITETIN